MNPELEEYIVLSLFEKKLIGSSLHPRMKYEYLSANIYMFIKHQTMP